MLAIEPQERILDHWSFNTHMVASESDPVNTQPKPSITDGYIPCGDEELDIVIPSAVEEYFGPLENGKRAEFRKADIKEKLNKVCWGWGESHDPELRSRSRDLKSRLLVSSLARVALSGDPSLVKAKDIPILDAYWRDVDDRFQNDIRDFALRNAGSLTPYHLNFSEDSDDEFHAMANVRDFTIYGRFLIRGGVYLHADYVAGHSSKSGLELIEDYREKRYQKQLAEEERRKQSNQVSNQAD